MRPGSMYANAIQIEAIADLQSKRLLALLEAARAAPFYRQLLAGRRLTELTLQELPVLSKTMLMQQFEQHLCDPQLKLADLQQLCRDPKRIAESYLGRYTVWESSGSSGQAGIYVQDPAAMALYETLEATRRQSPRPWQRLWDPLYLSERFAFVGATGGHFASHVSVERLRRAQPWLTGRWRSFSILQATPELLSQLNAFAPSIIATYPTAALLLAQEFEHGALRCRPQEIWTGGETLTAAMRNRIETAFGCALRNSYGASEFLPIAWECAAGQLHVNADWVILEPVDAQYRPTPRGQASHTTLLTNLANHVQPLIRFDLGDSITLAQELCTCGSALPVVEVLGRRDDMLFMPGRAGRRVSLLPLALTTVLEDEAGLFDFQLQQLADGGLQLILGADADQSRTARERYRRVLREFVLEQGAADLPISTCIAKPFTLGRSGKHKRIVAAATSKSESQVSS
ncbi:phenylacetate--CoA ligase family protein [Roseateles oligotrophus]|uniref:Phenylacetate--CoA ligase family protein n=1 Tax=Roseateles oligotrophus TaxID=1769250 RepID=A0ABT2YGG2_9BURK|nr:phenylacetate--CoA ligase family protein [Roseateles oligotrophus]MCV2369137.1 phenylacetate--CoA ligase family protein [Roseateles oligotrophus]